MRIQSLAITGFGPYTSRQELDFENSLRDATMFVITGNTGAGKTTIFDAIIYALYGEASGTGRDGSGLRSDFADAAVLTEVELRFSLRDKEYFVKRSPAYERAKQRGAGTTRKDADAQLMLPAGKILTGAKDVTAEIESILGISADQFRQLVMIPQGEFRKLLNADASQKESIFRKIFGTDVFVRIQSLAKEKARKIETDSAQLRRDRLNRLRGFLTTDAELRSLVDADEPDIQRLMCAFADAIAADKVEAKNTEAALAKTSVRLETLSKEQALAESNNKKLEDYAQRSNELDALNAQAGGADTKAAYAAKARLALSVAVHEKRAAEKAKDAENLGVQIADAQKRLEDYSRRFTQAQKDFDAQKKREEERGALAQSIKDLEALKLKVSAYQKASESLLDLERSVKTTQERIGVLDAQIASNEKALSGADSALSAIAALKDGKNALVLEKQKLLREGESLKKIDEALKNCAAAEQQHREKAESLKPAETLFAKAKAEYERIENLFRKSQAGILALDLNEGNPCPVCGSTVHPHPAAVEDSAITETLVKQSREAFESAKDARDRILNELTTHTVSINSLVNLSIAPAVKDLGLPVSAGDTEAVLREAGKLSAQNAPAVRELDTKLKEMDAAIAGEGALVQQKNTAKKQLEAFRSELVVKNRELTEHSGLLSAAQTTAASLRKDFPDGIKTSPELDREISSLIASLDALKKEYDFAQKALSDMQTRRDTEQGNCASLETRKTAADTQRDEAEKIFAGAVLSSGFSDEKEYRSFCRSEDEIKKIEKEVSDFRIAFERTKALFDALSSGIQGLSRVDLTQLNAKLQAERDQSSALGDRLSDIKIRLSANGGIAKDCSSYNTQLEKADADYETIGRLSKIVNGDNDRKISFERYVLAAYFDDIIAAANTRFRRMTDSRFELQRALESGDKRKSLGLEMEVYDNYTGKSRSVSTLSGGESFKASLCLALGMADVVQSHTGGIQLDTMFIDEGFGTLDPESLDNAIECLMELQSSGRLVGIISHVPELKERIPAKLEVVASNKGSRAAFI